MIYKYFYLLVFLIFELLFKTCNMKSVCCLSLIHTVSSCSYYGFLNDFSHRVEFNNRSNACVIIIEDLNSVNIRD